MSYNYYLDESGNSGDLIGKKVDLTFGNQPIFTLACIGVSNEEVLSKHVNELKVKHKLDDAELKSSELYFSNPKFLLDIAKLISNLRLPILVELVDKKYCITTGIVNHQIWTPHFTGDESNGEIQYIRNELADYMSANLTSECYEFFFDSCKNPSEKNLIKSMDTLSSFFKSKSNSVDFAELTVSSIEETIDDYRLFKSNVGENEAVKKFIPIPDSMKNGKAIHLLPHVHSIFSVIGRLNKYHLKELGNVILHHDKQEEFDDVLIYSKEVLENSEPDVKTPPVFNSDYDVTSNLNLKFVDSERSTGIQIADLVAGYFNRYINGLLYKEVEIDAVYHDIFMQFRNDFHPMSPLGVNFVIPKSKQQIIFSKFKF
ncbi:DUF3800 domain-containing protein [Psychromonas sp. Urea-02u-13]|uniref:DUF3800 domain-containing protein n=1 Tax=Psychromonas sp. Urea-02u-13 TaxID=2058326 RepID=UPI0012FF4E5E|nr:DUF3800 domain-containing protein [Psychromonas sp. Urea-02u-13]